MTANNSPDGSIAPRKKAAKKATISPDVERIQLEMKDTIEASGLGRVARVSSRNGDVRLLLQGVDDARMLQFLGVFLQQEENHAGTWVSFIGQKYFLNQGALTRAWVVFFDVGASGDLSASAQVFRRLVTACADRTAAMPKREEPEEMVVGLPWTSGTEERDRQHFVEPDTSGQRFAGGLRARPSSVGPDAAGRSNRPAFAPRR